MKKICLNSIFLLLGTFTINLTQAQVNRKLVYYRTGNDKNIWNYAVTYFLLSKGDWNYVREHVLRLYGEDSLSGEGNRFKITHTRKDLHFYDISSVNFPNDSTVTVNGTYYMTDYHLTENDRSKKFVSKNVDGVIHLMEVKTDSTGEKFLRYWYNNASVDLHDKDIKEIKVVNSDKWFHSESELRKFYHRYRMADAAYKTTSTITAIGIFILAVRNGKWGT